jgi:uncharacterized protein with GYD domain
VAHFLFQGSYTSESVSALIHTPEDRSVYVRSIVERLKGKLIGFWLALGTSGFYLVAELPDAEVAAAFAMSITAGGGVQNFSTTRLLTWQEGLNALKTAKLFGYQPPKRREK